MKVVFIGHTHSSKILFQAVLNTVGVKIVAVVGKSRQNSSSDFFSLEEMARKNKIPFFDHLTEKKHQIDFFIQEFSPDLIMCFGWNYLLKNETIALAKYGAWGFHPTALPLNRGRHPIIWALALGLTETASTFFKITDGEPDSGPILSQKKITIDYEDNASTLYKKIMSEAQIQIKEIIQQFLNNKLVMRNQDHSLANNWRKRSPADGVLDWKMNSRQLYNLVRSLGHPYPGATTKFKENNIVVWEVEELNCDENLAHLEPGKILEIINGKPIIKCGQGAIKINNWDYLGILNVGEYLS